MNAITTNFTAPHLRGVLHTILMVMMCLISGVSYGQGELYVSNTYSLFISETTIFHAEAGTINEGIITNWGTLSLKGGITGTEDVLLEEPCSLILLADTDYEFSNEADEKFSNLTIGASTASAAVFANGSLTITGNYNNTRTGSPGLILKAGNSQGDYAQFLPPADVTNAGITHVEQFFTAATTPSWRHIASPVAATLAQLEDDFALYFESTGSAAQWNLWRYDASPFPGQLGGVNPAANSEANATYWVPAANSAAVFDHTLAYNFYVGGPFFSVFNDGVLDVQGEFYNDDASYTLYKTHDFGYNSDIAAALGTAPFAGTETNQNLITGWNLIPNPYTTNISVPDLFADMPLNYRAVHVWDAPQQRYIAITDGLSTVVEWGNNDDDAITANNIAPFQTFWVKADLEAGSGSATHTQNLVLKTSFRTITKNLSFNKTAPPHIRLLVSSADSTKRDVSIVAFDAAYDNGLDDLDARYLVSSNGEMPSFYTLAGDVPTSINRLALPAPGHAVPLHLDGPKDGEAFAISMQDFETPFDWTYHIYDWHTKNLHDLKHDGSYTFSNAKNFEDKSRFTFFVNYKDAGYDVSKGVKILGTQEGIAVLFISQKDAIADVEIMDIAGKRLFSGNVPTNQRFEWPTNGKELTVYVVRVTTNQNHTIEKIIR
jgi:hypothetical protein